MNNLLRKLTQGNALWLQDVRFVERGSGSSPAALCQVLALRIAPDPPGYQRYNNNMMTPTHAIWSSPGRPEALWWIDNRSIAIT